MKNKILEEIKKEFFLQGLLQEKAEFKCLADGIITYNLCDSDNGIHEISIINENAIFLDREKISKLLNLKGTFFLSYRYFKRLYTSDYVAYEQYGETKTFRLIDTDGFKIQNKSMEQN